MEIIYTPQLWRLVLLLLHSYYYLHQMGINKPLQPTCVAVAFATRAQASATLHDSPTSLVVMFFTTTSVSICAITAVTTITNSSDTLYFLVQIETVLMPVENIQAQKHIE
jgi:hypothetical protein